MLAERRIERAFARGEFDHLPGAGRPLDLDDELLVAAEVRIAHRILRYAGCVLPEIAQLAELRGALAQLERSRGRTNDDASAVRVARRACALLVELELAGRPATAQSVWLSYHRAVAARLGERGLDRAAIETGY